jgi:chromosome transmission fidelity protein 1
MEELGHVIANICSVVPDGVVVFFSSYHYEEQIHNFWKEKGIDKRIEAKKKVLVKSKIDSLFSSHFV